ncbi:MAG TPA: hypothetical protein VML94_08315 [Thermoplasmata archaeon]|nr:hypothetical protein [Thermoplasmata archaeon]
MSEIQPLDREKLNQFIGRFGQDLGAAMHGSTLVLGERLGTYKALNVPGGTDARGAREGAREPVQPGL